MSDFIQPQDLKVGDRVHANAAIVEVTALGIMVGRMNPVEHVEVKVVDPLNTGLRIGYTKELKRTPLSGVWQRAA